MRRAGLCRVCLMPAHTVVKLTVTQADRVQTPYSALLTGPPGPTTNPPCPVTLSSRSATSYEAAARVTQTAAVPRCLSGRAREPASELRPRDRERRARVTNKLNKVQRQTNSLMLIHGGHVAHVGFRSVRGLALSDLCESGLSPCSELFFMSLLLLLCSGRMLALGA